MINDQLLHYNVCKTLNTTVEYHNVLFVPRVPLPNIYFSTYAFWAIRDFALDFALDLVLINTKKTLVGKRMFGSGTRGMKMVSHTVLEYVLSDYYKNRNTNTIQILTTLLMLF